MTEKTPRVVPEATRIARADAALRGLTPMVYKDIRDVLADTENAADDVTDHASSLAAILEGDAKSLRAILREYEALDADGRARLLRVLGSK